MNIEWDYGEGIEKGLHKKLHKRSSRALSEQPGSEEIASAIQGIRNRLDILASITSGNILIPGDPQERYHEMIEEAYAALSQVETVVDELRAELEYQHQRLDEIRDAALAGNENKEGEEAG